MAVEHNQNSSPKKNFISYRYQKIGNPLRLGNNNYQYLKDSNGNLVRTSRPIIQKVDHDG